MLFKRKGDYVEEDTLDVTDYDYHKKIKKLIRKQKFIQGSKKTLLFIVVFFGLVGGYRSYSFIESSNAINTLEDEAFLSNYVEASYQYPLTSDASEFIKKFSLYDSTVKYDNSIKSASVVNVSVYHVEESDTISTFYFEFTLSTNTEEETSSTRRYGVVDIARIDSKYMVISPITYTTYDRVEITDKDTLDGFVKYKELPGLSVADSIKEDISNTLTLFLKTYNEDLVQARLLCSNHSVIELIDSSVTLSLNNIIDIKSDENSIYVTTTVDVTTRDMGYKKAIKYYFEIDIKTNKIRVMEGF